MNFVVHQSSSLWLKKSSIFFCPEISIFYATTKSTILKSEGQIYLTFKISILTFHSKVKLPTIGHFLLCSTKLSIYFSCTRYLLKSTNPNSKLELSQPTTGNFFLPPTKGIFHPHRVYLFTQLGEFFFNPQKGIFLCPQRNFFFIMGLFPNHKKSLSLASVFLNQKDLFRHFFLTRYVLILTETSSTFHPLLIFCSTANFKEYFFNLSLYLRHILT